MPGQVYTGLIEAATGQYGYVTTADARAVGVDPAQLRIMYHRGHLDHLARGLYRFHLVPATPLDQYMEATLWPQTTAALSHETALDLHGLCDINPGRIHISVPADYRLRRDVPLMYELHRRNLKPNDVTVHEGIPIVTVLRAIRDGIEARLGDHLVDQALETARRRGLLTPAEIRMLRRERTAAHRRALTRSPRMSAARA